MSQITKRLCAAVIALAAALALPGIAIAHNAGHIFLGDGTCLEVGSFHSAPLVGKDRTQLDLVPQTPNPPRDEYGVSFVGFYGNTPILPGGCPATATLAEGAAASVNLQDELVASQPFNGL